MERLEWKQCAKCKENIPIDSLHAICPGCRQEMGLKEWVPANAPPQINRPWVFRVNGKLPLPVKDVESLMYAYSEKGHKLLGIDYGYFNTNNYIDELKPAFWSHEHPSPNLDEVMGYLILPTEEELQAEFDRLNSTSSEA